MKWAVQVVGDQIYLENEEDHDHMFLSKASALDLSKSLSDGLKMLPAYLSPPHIPNANRDMAVKRHANVLRALRPNET